ncbi:AI-2E family transporter [Domibacillus mangrovi]|uniref:AI-2E family transporter n=1 Tax=Domibacillus mangrovi TaxID=1714354 RepID=A0A1Q5P045_9BACI|nr:AI-2E family transporter [Domibacillus mangrovi]OKL35629.1 AI-2E family transporter [Domibacillus mangrovi]
MKENEPQRPPLVRFLGGRTSIFVLSIVLLIGLIIMVFSQISFIFDPLSGFIGTVALPVILSIVGYYLLSPLVNGLQRYKIKRGWGILLVFIVLSGLITILLLTILPFLRDQTEALIASFPGYARQLGMDIDMWARNSPFETQYMEISKNMQTNAEEFLGSLTQNFSDIAGQTLDSVTGLIAKLTNFVVSLVTVPFILFYLLKDGTKLYKGLLHVLPPKMRGRTGAMLIEMDEQLRSYIQGQMLVSLCIGIMMYIGFLIIGLDYALLLAAIASVTSIVPYLGPVIAITPAIIIAIVTSPFMVLKLVIVWTIVQLLEGKLISPQIMGKSLQIHPVTIIFVLLTAAHLYGVVGVLIGLPTYALIKVLIQYLFALYKQRYNRFSEKETDRYAIVENDDHV